MRSEDDLTSLEELIEIFLHVRKMMDFSTPMMTGVQASEMGDLLQVEQVRSSLSESSRLAILTLHELNTVYSTCHEGYQVFYSTICSLEKLLAELDGGEMVSRSFMCQPHSFAFFNNTAPLRL